MRTTLRFMGLLVACLMLGDAGLTSEVAVAVVNEVAEVEAPVVPQASPQPPDMRRFAKLVEDAARAHGVDEALVHAVILAESSYDPNAVSSAGASGLMQLTAETARRNGVRDRFDPADNIGGGVRHLKRLLVLFDGDVELALAAYNAGENAVIRAGNRVPPYAETRAFVPRVIRHYRSLRPPPGKA